MVDEGKEERRGRIFEMDDMMAIECRNGVWFDDPEEKICGF